MADKEERCPSCKLRVEKVIRWRDDTPNPRQWICGNCGAGRGWAPKPENEKKRRQGKHRKLVKKYGEGYCQLCLIMEQRLPSGETLEGHHIVEYRDGGEASKENTLVLCTACHSLVNWRRTYQRHMVGENGVYHADGQCGEGSERTGGTQPVGVVEDGSAWERQADEGAVSGRRDASQQYGQPDMGDTSECA